MYLASDEARGVTGKDAQLVGLEIAGKMMHGNLETIVNR